MKRKFQIGLLFLFVSAISAEAQSIWASGEFKYGISPKWGAGAEIEYRTTNNLESTDRWTFAAGGEFKPWKFIKFDAGYKYILHHSSEKTTKKGNIIPPYRTDRHRFYISAVGKLKLGRFEFSLRERYQFTRRVGKYVPKFASDGVTPKDDEWIESDNKNILRSRIGCEWNIKKSRFNPFANIELHDNPEEKFAVEKIRFTIGSDYKINKHNSFELFYRYIHTPSGKNTEDRGHVIGVSYTFRL